MVPPAPADPDSRLGWRATLALALAGVAVRGAATAALALRGAFGEDAEFWGYRAVELQHGILHGLHPALYPGLVALVASLAGVSVPAAGTAASFACGVLMAPAMAAACAPLVGRRAAVLTGVFVLLLPGVLAASLRFDPTGLFVLTVAGILYASGRALRDLSPGWGALAGVCVATACIAKENGLQYTVFLGALAIVGVQRRRWWMAGLPVAAFLVAFAGLHGLFGEVRGGAPKAAVPFRDLAALVERGVVPVPLVGKEDAAIRLSQAEQEELSSPTTSPSRRLLLYVGVQARRLWRFLGVWLLVTPFAVAATVGAWHAGGLATWQGLALAALGSSALPAAVVIVQPRHAEPGMFGVVVAGALGLSRLPSATRRVAVPLAVLVAALQGAFLLRSREASPVQALARCAEEQDQVAREILHQVGSDRLCSPLPWVGFRTGRPVMACDGEGPDDVLTPGAPAWFLLDGSAGDRARSLRAAGAHLVRKFPAFADRSAVELLRGVARCDLLVRCHSPTTIASSMLPSPTFGRGWSRPWAG